MSLSDFKSQMRYEKNYSNLQIRKSLKELQTKTIEWDVDEKGHGASASMLAYFEIEKTGVLRWAFTLPLVDKLFAIGYTPLKIATILSFDSKYSLALYENLQIRKSFLRFEFSLEEFRALMGLEADELLRVQNLKMRCLSPAIIEINEKTDMLVTYKDIKQGTKVIGFEFSWENLTEQKIKQRNTKKEQIEGYRKTLSEHFGKKFKIAGKWYTLTKDGFVNRGKILGGFDIVESYNQYSILDKQGFVTEKNVIAKTKTKKLNESLFL